MWFGNLDTPLEMLIYDFYSNIINVLYYGKFIDEKDERICQRNVPMAGWLYLGKALTMNYLKIKFYF